MAGTRFKSRTCLRLLLRGPRLTNSARSFLYPLTNTVAAWIPLAKYFFTS